jgi:hypothetical protein
MYHNKDKPNPLCFVDGKCKRGFPKIKT